MPDQAKPKTIDEFCRKPAGSFTKFIGEKKGFQRALEVQRRERIRICRETALELSWAA